ncbi:MAG: hypothetical protein IPM25_01230 [Chloracidobacterium sp.]|nr:hypothetical protein [Chloracidobacterium sp.]
MKQLFGKILIVAVVVALACATAYSQKRLGNQEVINMVKAGLSADTIIPTIRANPTGFDVSAAAVTQLKRSGVPESVIQVMIELSSNAPKSQDEPRGMFEVRGPVPSGSPQPTNSQVGSSGPGMGAANTPKPSGENLSQKRTGVPRIGIVTTTSKVPEEQDEALRLQIYEMLYGNRPSSSVDAVLLREKLDRNIMNEAKLTGADFVLFLSLESTIKSVNEQGKTAGFFRGAARAAAEATGIVNRNSPYYGKVYRETYKTHRVLDSLERSNQLLDAIDKSTDRKDKVSLRFRMVSVADNSVIIPESNTERTAQRDKEPVFRNLLVVVGNKILNAIPENVAISAKPTNIPLNQPTSAPPIQTSGNSPSSGAASHNSSTGLQTDVAIPVSGQTCFTPTSQAPALRGIKLGMSREQANSVLREAGVQILPVGESRPVNKSYVSEREECWDKAFGGCYQQLYFYSGGEQGRIGLSESFKDLVELNIKVFSGKVMAIRSAIYSPALKAALDGIRGFRPSLDRDTESFFHKEIQDSLGLRGWKGGGNPLQCSGFTADYDFAKERGRTALISFSLTDQSGEKAIERSRQEFRDRRNKQARDAAGTIKP